TRWQDDGEELPVITASNQPDQHRKNEVAKHTPGKAFPGFSRTHPQSQLALTPATTKEIATKIGAGHDGNHQKYQPDDLLLGPYKGEGCPGHDQNYQTHGGTRKTMPPQNSA